MPFKSKNITWFPSAVPGTSILPTAPISPLRSMDSPSHSTNACINNKASIHYMNARCVRAETNTKENMERQTQIKRVNLSKNSVTKTRNKSTIFYLHVPEQQRDRD